MSRHTAEKVGEICQRRSKISPPGRSNGLPPFFVPVPMLVLARFLGRADPAVAHQ